MITVNFNYKCGLLFSLVIWVAFVPQAWADERNDLLDLASGAVLIEATSEYDQKWAAMMLLDGGVSMGWCSAKGKSAPNTFTIELARQFLIKSFSIDNSGVQEKGYPGISARHFKLYLSKDSAQDGFQLIYEGEAAKGERKEFTLEKPVAGQWMKLEILSNWGHAQFTEIMELEAYGEPTGEAVTPSPINGVFKTNFKLLWLAQSGNQVEGCYDWDNGRFTGTTEDGRVIRFQWSEDGPQVGSAMMVLTSDGSFLNGIWYEKGRYQGLWYGTLAEDGSVPQCRAGVEADSKEDPIGRSLDEAGRVILYGIYFDFDSATLRSDSVETLEQVLTAVKARPSLQLVVEGHTDSQGSDDYNLKLSDRRAQSVVQWLVSNGIDSGQLTARGYGEGRPVADNDRPDGRALNRRVEMAVVK
jgi:outer membrane protein OmpA-like peptidoglycan-associated protein